MGNYRSNDVDKSFKQTIELSISFINEDSISFSDFSDLEPQNLLDQENTPRKIVNDFNIFDLDRQIILVSNESLSSSDSDP
jgi:hypothetical protein